jgi:nitrite reductase (NADH) small subunit
LHQGFLEGTVVTCPWHGWDFDLKPATPDPCDGVVRFPVRVEEGKVLVEI